MTAKQYLMPSGTGYDDYSTGVQNFRRVSEDTLVTLDSEPIKGQVRVIFPNGRKGVASVHTLRQIQDR